AASAANGHLADSLSHKGRMFQYRGFQTPSHPLQKYMDVFLLFQLSDHTASLQLMAVLKPVYIISHFFIGMAAEKGLYHILLPVLLKDHFYADLRFFGEFARFTDKRIAFLVSAECSFPLYVETATVVFAYLSGPGSKECIKHFAMVALRHKRNQLAQDSFLW